MSMAFFIQNTQLHVSMVFIICIISLIPFFILFLSSKHLLLHIKMLSVLFLFLSVFALSFRKIRDILPPPEITEQKIVGYSHFFGYPFFLDTVIFFFFILYPFLAYITIIFIQKLKNRL
jgi:hypothetical protein